MRTRPLGSSGLEASVVGLGTWAIGGWLWGGSDEQESLRAIHAALDAGITLIDTAPIYGLGLAEEVVGKALRERRDEVIIATKCGLVWHTDRGEPFFEEHGKPVHRYLGAESIRYEIEQSLRRLNTDHVDLYQTHWQEDTTPIAETMRELLSLKDEGKIRAIGVSNVRTQQLQRYLACGPVASAQELYSMLDRDIERDLLPYCCEREVALLAYSPLALGLLAGKLGPEREFAGDDQRRANPRFSRANRAKVQVMLDAFHGVAEHHNATPAQLVIAWTVAQPGVTVALCGARTTKHAQENAAAGDIVLSDDDLATMNAAIARYAAGIPSHSSRGD